MIRWMVACLAGTLALGLAGNVSPCGIDLHGPTVSELCMYVDAIFIGTAGETTHVVSRDDWTVSKTPIRVEKWIRGEPRDEVLLFHHTRGDGLRGPSFRFTRSFEPGERVLVFAEHKRLLQRRAKTFRYAVDLSDKPAYAIYYTVNGRGSGFVFTILKNGRTRETYHYHCHPKTLKQALDSMKPWLDRPEPHEGIQAQLILYDPKRYGPGSSFLSLRNVGREDVTLDSYAYPDDAYLEVFDRKGKMVKSVEAFGYRRKWKKRDPPSIADILVLSPGDAAAYITENVFELSLPPGSYRVRARVNRVQRQPHLPGTILTGEFFSNSVPLKIE